MLWLESFWLPLFTSTMLDAQLLPIDAHLPHDYVPGERLRLAAAPGENDRSVAVGREVDAAGADVRSIAVHPGYAATNLQREVSRNLKLRWTPHLRFVYDEGLDASLRIESLLAEIASDQGEGGEGAAEHGSPR